MNSILENEILDILVVSDIHNSLDNLNKLYYYCKKSYYKPNFIFCLGDILSYPYWDQEKKSLENESIEQLKIIIQTLEKISENVIYIPGNHDNKIFFEENSPKLTEKSINLHKKYLEIRKNFYVLGLGGSISNFKTDEDLTYFKYNIKSKDIIWEGYPYINEKGNSNFEECDKLLLKDLTETYSKINLNSKTQILLLVHNGPINSPTTNSIELCSNNKKKIIYSGSLNLNNFIKNNSQFINGCLHGHTHLGNGEYNLNNVKIINPGALLLGKFAKMKIIKNNNKLWEIKSIDFLKL